jgi:hypothetical protein
LKKVITMDLQTRKLNFIQNFLKLESEKAIAQFEKLLKKETNSDSEFTPLTINEFQKRIDKSTQDSKKGNLTEVNDLISEIEKWS